MGLADAAAAPSGADAASAIATAAALSVDGTLRQLARGAPLRGAHLHVQLADSWVHVDVAAGDFAVEGIRQLHTIALAYTYELLGDRSTEHETRWHLQDDARHLLICATHRETLTLISDAARRFGLELASVRPLFSTHWNRHGRSLKRAAVFVVASSRYAMIAFAEYGVISAISSGAWRGRGDDLDAWVDRVLSSLGWNRAAPATFMLVTTEAAAISPSQRWTVIEPSQAA